ncbi:hypothetical protein WDW89_23885 [Deltaproteobacteria bacterium TL4]
MVSTATLKRLKSLLSFLVLCVLAFSSALAEETASETDLSSSESPAYYEGFIAFQVRKNQGNSFYRVMMDQEEHPYIDMEDALFHWMEMRGSCDVETRHCIAESPIKKHTYQINGKTFQLQSTALEDPLSFPAEGLIFVEDKMWLRYDLWEQWVPVTVSWSLSQFFLRFIPQYPPLKDVTQQREELRKKYLKNKVERERIESIPPLAPTDIFRNELRYRLQYSQELTRLQEEGVRAQFSDFFYEYNADYLEGTLQGSGSFTQIESQKQIENIDFSQWRYTRLGQKYFHLFEMGDLRLSETLIVPSLMLKTGFRLQRLEPEQGVGILNFSGFAPIGTEVELYHNGLLVAFTKVQPLPESKLDVLGLFDAADGTGIYEFQDVHVSGGGVLSLNYYYPDGFSKEEIIRIAPDNGRILAPKNWDAQFYYGDAPSGEIAHVDFRYGLLSNGSMGLHFYQLYDELQSLMVGVDQFMGIAGVDLAYRPFYGLTLLAEKLQSEISTDYGVLVNISYFNPHVIELEARFLDPLSPFYRIYSGEQKSTEFYQLTHNITYKEWAWQARYFQNTIEQALQPTLRYRISYQWSIYTEPEFKRFFNGEYTDKKMYGAEYSSEYQGVKLVRTLQNAFGDTTFTYRFQGKELVPWDLTFNLTLPDDNETRYSLSILWNPTSKINTSLRIYEQGQSGQINWTDIISHKQGPTDPRHFGMGTLSGRVMVPARPDQLPLPLAGVVVKAGTQRGVTDINGKYIITGLPTYQRIEVKLEPSSIDIGLLPKKDFEVVIFRPSTQIEYDPELTWSAGIDGSVELEPEPQLEISIEAINESHQVVSFGTVEVDGFFVIERLTPGTYWLQVKGHPKPPPPFKIVVDEGVDWISGIHIKKK